MRGEDRKVNLRKNSFPNNLAENKKGKKPVIPIFYPSIPGKKVIASFISCCISRIAGNVLQFQSQSRRTIIINTVINGTTNKKGKEKRNSINTN
jgi:hypothetical protein